MELNNTVKVLGCIIFSLMIFSVPVLTALSFALGWSPAIRFFLTIASACMLVALITLLYAEVTE